MTPSAVAKLVAKWRELASPKSAGPLNGIQQLTLLGCADALEAALATAPPEQGIDWVAQNKLAQAEEKKDCERALLALAGWYPTPVEGYGFNTSWAISDLCRAIVKLRESPATAPPEQAGEPLSSRALSALAEDILADAECTAEKMQTIWERAIFDKQNGWQVIADLFNANRPSAIEQRKKGR